MAAEETKKVPERQCVGCRTKRPKNEFIRIVRTAETGTIELDRTGKKSGRGAYICPSADCLKKARKKLGAALDCQIPDEIFDKLEKEINGNE